MQGFLALEKLRIVKLLRVIGRALFIRRRRGNLKNAGRGGINKKKKRRRRSCAGDYNFELSSLIPRMIASDLEQPSDRETFSSIAFSSSDSRSSKREVLGLAVGRPIFFLVSIDNSPFLVYNKDRADGQTVRLSH